jgi:hypothetical protein
VLDDPRMLEVVRRFAEYGEEVRIADSLPLKLLIADGSTVLCDMPDPVARAGATTSLVIRHPSLAETLRVAFHSIWERSPSLDEALKAQEAEAQALDAGGGSPRGSPHGSGGRGGRRSLTRPCVTTAAAAQPQFRAGTAGTAQYQLLACQNCQAALGLP